MQITIAGTANILNRYHVAFDKQIRQEALLKMQTEAAMTARSAQRSWAAPNIEATDIVQPFQCPFTPKTSATFDVEELTLQAGKIDVEFTCEDLEGFFDNFMIEHYEVGKSLEKWKFPKWFYTNIMLPRYAEEMEYMIWKGKRVDPTLGTAGAYLDTFTGLASRIEDAITAGKIAPIPTGVIDQTTVLEAVKFFARSIPSKYRRMDNEVWCSQEVADMYFDAYLAENKIGGLMDAKNTGLRIDGTSLRLVAKPCMEGSSRLLFTAKDNRIALRRKGEATVPTLRWQEADRTLKGLAEFHRAYGFAYYRKVFVNDQV